MSRFGPILCALSGLLLTSSAFASAVAPIPASATPSATPAIDSVLIPIVPVRRKVRRPARHADAPTAAVLTGAELRAGEPRLADQLARTMSAKVERAGGLGHAAQLRIRASSTQQVVWALDDVPLRSPDGSPFDPADIPVSALGAAEIYRGGSPAGLGAAAIGGAVRLVLRRPTLGGFQVFAGTGTWGTHLVDGAVAWRAMGDGLLAFRAVTTNGDYPYLHDGGTLLRADDDEWRQRQNNAVTRASLVLRQRFSAGKWRLELRGLGAAKRQGLPGLALYESVHSTLSTQRGDLVLAASRRGLLQRNDRVTTTAYVGGFRTAVNDVSGEQGIPIELAQTVLAQAVTARWQGPAKQRWRGEVRTAVESGELTGRDAAQDTDRPDVRQSQVDVTAGGRWRQSDAVSVFIYANVARVLRQRFGLQPEANAWAAIDAPDVWVGSGSASALWRVSPRWALHASARAASRAANLAELYGNSGTVVGNPLLRDERAIGGQLGAKFQIFGRATKGGPTSTIGRPSAEVRATLFAREATDLISLVRVSPARAVYWNLGATRNLGAEIGADLRQTVRFAGATLRTRLDASWAFLHGRDTSDDVRYQGNALPFAPLSTGQIRTSAARDLPLRWLTAVETSAGWRWRAGHFADRAATIVIPPMQTLTASVNLRLGAGLSCGFDVESVVGSGAFDVLGFPRPTRMLLARCGVSSWGQR